MALALNTIVAGLQSVVVGDVLFNSMEIPERLPVSWKQSNAINEFPGGTRTIYAMGSFPRPMTWEGWLMGTTAFLRVAALERLCAAGLSVQMNYGVFSWLGLVTEFESIVEHQFQVRYRMTFEPIKDLSGMSNIPPLLLQAEGLLAAAVTTFDTISAGTRSGLPLPYQLGVPAAAVDTAVARGQLDSHGVVAAMPHSDVSAITLAVSNLGLAASPIVAGTDATQASPALDIFAYGAGIGGTVSVPNPATRVLHGQVNPNLFALAAQYLGDATAWLSIASASGINPPDPMPTGIFTIIIPPP